MAVYGFCSILGAARGKTALIAHKWAQEKLVHPDHSLQQLLHELERRNTGEGN
jgi:hypothetical protein